MFQDKSVIRGGNSKNELKLDRDAELPPAKQYSWEDKYQRSWEAIHEDSEGRLVSDLHMDIPQWKRSNAITESIKRVFIRSLFIVVDLSAAIEEKDIAPSRLAVTVNNVRRFILEFFEENPLSKLGLIITRNRSAERWVELTANPFDLLQVLPRMFGPGQGAPSIQNALELARTALRTTPSYTSREILFISASLTTADPGDIRTSIKHAKSDGIRISVLGLAAEMLLFKMMTKETAGRYEVIDESCYETVLMSWVLPLHLSPTKMTIGLLPMGFPIREYQEIPTLCSCHNRLSVTGYCCPRCGAKNCQIPVECGICHLLLAQCSNLARYYHYLFPVRAFVTENKVDDELLNNNIKREVDAMDVDEDESLKLNLKCFACLIPIKEKGAKSDIQSSEKIFNSETDDDDSVSYLVCPDCKEKFCESCSVFIHNTLHNCPGCDASRTVKEEKN